MAGLGLPHIEVRENEKADELSKRALKRRRIEMDVKYQ